MNIATHEQTILNALRLAARRYEADAKLDTMPKRLREQFITQARDALTTAELLEVGEMTLSSALSGSPPTRATVGAALGSKPAAVNNPAVTGNSGGISFEAVIRDVIAIDEITRAMASDKS